MFITREIDGNILFDLKEIISVSNVAISAAIYKLSRYSSNAQNEFK